MQEAIRHILATHLSRAGAGTASLLAAAALAQEPPPAIEAAPRPPFEGAMGLQLNNSPQYQGSDLRKTRLIPGLYLRWGRFSLATSGNFVTRQDDEVVRGVGAELVQRPDLRVSLGLRYDPGRKTSASTDLSQLDEVRRTVRGRLSAVWQPAREWRLGAGWSNDLLGRGGGALVDFGVAREFRLAPRTEWSLGANVSWGDERYMQGRFGISPQAAARSGKAAYVPGGGWRDASLSTQWRHEIDKRWTTWAGASVSRLIGPGVLDSPLTVQPTQTTLGAGFAWRF